MKKLLGMALFLGAAGLFAQPIVTITAPTEGVVVQPGSVVTVVVDATCSGCEMGEGYVLVRRESNGRKVATCNWWAPIVSPVSCTWQVPNSPGQDYGIYATFSTVPQNGISQVVTTEIDISSSR